MSRVFFAPYGGITAFDGTATKSLKIRHFTDGFHLTPTGDNALYLDVKSDRSNSLKIHSDVDGGIHITPVGNNIMYLDAKQVKYKFINSTSHEQEGSLWDFEYKMAILKANMDANDGLRVLGDNQINAAVAAMAIRLHDIEQWIAAQQSP